MKEIKKRITVLFLVLFVLSTSINKPLAVAANSVVAEYGFKVPSTGYTWRTGFRSTELNVYTSNIKHIGTAETVVVRARSTRKDSFGRHIDTFLIRTEMQPRRAYDPVKKEYYHGLNRKTVARLKLNSNQTHINFAPKATMPESTTTWDVSLGAGASTGGGLGFTIGTGYSSTVKDSLCTVSSKYTSSDKTYFIEYDYKVNNDFFSSAAKRATNKWANNTHHAFYAFTYAVNQSNRKDVVVDYAAYFRYAISDSKTYDGSTWDVESPLRVEAHSVTYIGSY